MRLGSVVSLTIALFAGLLVMAPSGLSAAAAQPAPQATGGPTIDGVVWIDADGDAVRAVEETGIADVAVSLWALDSAGDPIAEVATTRTDADGYYLLTPFAPGDYRVHVEVPGDFVAPPALADGYGPIVALGSEAVEAFNVGLLAVEVPEPQPQEDVPSEPEPSEPEPAETAPPEEVVPEEVPAEPKEPEAAEQFADPVSEPVVHGTVFDDRNRNGQRDADDPGFAGVAVELRDTADTIVATTQTDVEGRYTLVAPLAGTYFVHVIAPAETVFGRSNLGDDATDSDVDEDGVVLVTLQPGVDVVIDAGLWRVVSVRGTFWVDENENGQREPGEPPVVGLPVVALDPDQQYWGETVTDTNGEYEITSLPPGNYYALLYNGGQGVRFTAANVGDDATDSDFELPDRSGTFELRSGAAVIDGGVLRSAALQVSLSDPPGTGFGHRAVIRVGDVTDSLYANTVELAVAPFSSSLLELWLEPASAWELRGVTCTGDVTTTWTDFGNGYSQATLDVGAPGDIACTYDTTHLPTQPVSVTFDAVGPDGSPPVPVQVVTGYAGGEPYDQYTTVIAPGQSDTILLEPGSSSRRPVLRVERPPIGWDVRLRCPANVPIEVLGISSIDFELDLLAVPGQSIACTFAVTEAEPATVEWTNTHTGLESPTIYLWINGRSVSTAQTATGSAIAPIALGSFQTTLRITSGIESLDTFTCSLNGETFEPAQDFGDQKNVVVPGVAAGDTVRCASTTSDGTRSVVTIVDDAGQTLDVHVSPRSSAGFDMTVDGTATFEVPADTIRLYFDVGTARRFRDLVCDQTPTSRPNPALGFAVFDLTNNNLTCTVSSFDQPNPPVTVTLVPVSTDDTPLPSVALYPDGFFATAGVWDPGGVTLQHSLGVGDPTNGVIDGVLLRFVAPPGWQPSAAASQCDGAGVVSFAARVSPPPVLVDVSEAEPGASMRCEIALEPPAETVPLTLTLDAGASGATSDTEVRYGLVFEPPQSLTVGETIELPVASGTVFTVYATVGYEIARLNCDGLADPEFSRSPSGSMNLWVSWSVGESPTSIDCVASLVATPPARVVMTTALQGAAGNGDVAFELSGQAFDAAVAINGAGSITVEVPGAALDLTATLPVTMRNLAVSCDRVFDAEVDGLTVEIDLEPGETVECTFVNEMVSQSVGVSGDVTCDGLVDIIDALVIAQYEARTRTTAQACPLVDVASELLGSAADFDGSGAIDILDALQVARCTVGLPAAGCVAAFALD